MKLQTNEIKGAPSAIVPIRDYDQLRDALEDAADREALRQSRASGEELVPDALVDRLADDGSPARLARVPRADRHWLARHAKVSSTRLSAMENGAATGSVPARTLREIAVALGVTVGDLLPSAGQGSAP